MLCHFWWSKNTYNMLVCSLRNIHHLQHPLILRILRLGRHHQPPLFLVPNSHQNMGHTKADQCLSLPWFFEYQVHEGGGFDGLCHCRSTCNDVSTNSAHGTPHLRCVVVKTVLLAWILSYETDVEDVSKWMHTTFWAPFIFETYPLEIYIHSLQLWCGQLEPPWTHKGLPSVSTPHPHQPSTQCGWSHGSRFAHFGKVHLEKRPCPQR